MLVLSTRLNEKILFPDTDTTVEVVAIQGTTIRLGITAPQEVRILRQGIPDRVAEWGTECDSDDPIPTLQNIKKLIDKRLEITREGIDQARQCLRNGQDEDARVLLEKIDEDLHLLRRRVRREVEKADAPCGLGI